MIGSQSPSRMSPQIAEIIRSSDVVLWAILAEGGAGIFFSVLCRVLSDHGLRVAVITHGQPSSLRDADYGRFSVVGVHNPLDYLRVCALLVKAAGPVLVYHMTEVPPPFALPLRLLGPPTIPTIVGSDWFDNVRPRLLSGSPVDRVKARCVDSLYQLLASGRTIVASTEEILGIMKERYGTDRRIWLRLSPTP